MNFFSFLFFFFSFFILFFVRFNAEPEERQPDGSNNELCTFLRLYSIHSTQNWHDLACSYDKVYRYICEVPAYGSANGWLTTNRELSYIKMNYNFEKVALYHCMNCMNFT